MGGQHRCGPTGQNCVLERDLHDDLHHRADRLQQHLHDGERPELRHVRQRLRLGPDLHGHRHHRRLHLHRRRDLHQLRSDHRLRQHHRRPQQLRRLRHPLRAGRDLRRQRLHLRHGPDQLRRDPRLRQHQRRPGPLRELRQCLRVGRRLRLGAVLYPTGDTNCGNVGAAAVCTSLTTDPSHCGNCTIACAQGDICAAGVCNCNGTMCPSTGGNTNVCADTTEPGPLWYLRHGLPGRSGLPRGRLRLPARADLCGGQCHDLLHDNADCGPAAPRAATAPAASTALCQQGLGCFQFGRTTCNNGCYTQAQLALEPAPLLEPARPVRQPVRERPGLRAGDVHDVLHLDVLHHHPLPRVRDGHGLLPLPGHDRGCLRQRQHLPDVS